MNIKQYIARYEERLQRVNPYLGKTHAELNCGKQYLLVKCANRFGYELVPDGLCDPNEFAIKVYRLNIFGKLVEQPFYSLF